MSKEAVTIILIGTSILLLILAIYYIYETLKKSFVKKNSKIYQKINELHEITEIHYITEEPVYKRSYTSTSSLYRVDMDNLALMFIEDDYDNLNDILQDYEECEQEYSEYSEKFNKILNSKYKRENIELKKVFFSDYEKFKEYELKLCESLKLSKLNIFYIHVIADYTSPAGRNYYKREEYYNASDIIDFMDMIANRNEYKKTAKYQREIMSDSIRYDVLKRDGYRCQICGASSKEDGVKLEVDHIVPVSKGGLTTMSNLQTLCERCNRGKSNK